MLADDAAVSHHVILVDVDGFALPRDFDGALAVRVVGVLAALAVVVYLADAVVFVPQDDAARAVGVVAPAQLVAVGVIGKRAVADVGGGVRLGSAVEVVPFVGGGFLHDSSRLAGACRRASCVGDGVGLVFADDVVDVVVGQPDAVELLKNNIHDAWMRNHCNYDDSVYTKFLIASRH